MCSSIWATLRGASAGFDAILASHAFDEGGDPSVLLQGAAAALRPGGRLFLWETTDGGDGGRAGAATSPDEACWRGPELVERGAAAGLAPVACEAAMNGAREAMLVFERPLDSE